MLVAETTGLTNALFRLFSGYVEHSSATPETARGREKISLDNSLAET